MSYLVEPIQALGLSATIFGVRYPEPLVRQLADAGIERTVELAAADAGEAQVVLAEDHDV